MNRRGKIIVSVVGIFIVLLVLVGITYGYFLTRIQGNTNTTSITVTTADLKLIYGDGNENIESASVLMPGEDFKFVGRDSQGNVLTNEDGKVIEYDSKTFTVTNDGNTTVENYAVVLEDVSVTYASNATLEDGTIVSEGQETTFDRPQDFVYILTCESTDNNGCNGQTEMILPMQDSILVTNTIAKDVTHNYTLKIKYIEPDIDQSKDMNKTFKMKVNIYDVRTFNPYENNKNSLAYNIINNSMNKINGTELLSVPATPVAEDIARFREEKLYTESKWFYGTYAELLEKCYATDYTTCTSDMIGKYIGTNCSDEPTAIITKCENGKPIVSDFIDKYESSMSVEQDDFGTSYYYRGAVIDNYVNFAGMCWRIVRIEGDGSIKIILEDQNQECDSKDENNNLNMDGDWGIPTETGGSSYIGRYGYRYQKVTNSNGEISSVNKYIMNYLQPSSGKPMVKAFYDFQSDELSQYLDKLKVGNWCFADTAYSRENTNFPYEYKSLLLQNKNITDFQYNSLQIYYDSHVRLYGNESIGYSPTLKCTGEKINKFLDLTYEEEKIIEESPMYVGTLTADEVVYAGGRVYGTNGNFYLLNENFKNEKLDYKYFWTLSVDHFDGTNDNVLDLGYDGLFSYDRVQNRSIAFRPVVSLIPNINITKGKGTQAKPYVIETN